MIEQYFITGTDTGVGKTLASAILVSLLNAYYWKPIQSGIEDEISEENKIQQLVSLSDDKILNSNYALRASLSPDQAAKLENKVIDLDTITFPSLSENLIVEGAGGVYVPVNDEQSMLDVMQKLNLPVIIVARGTLGTINHTLLTIEALRQKELDIHGVIFSGELNFQNQLAIEKWGQIKTLFHIPYFEKLNRESVQTWININRDQLWEHA
jgi:dethiobiotin synthase